MKRAWIFFLLIRRGDHAPIGAQQVPKGQMPILGRATESTDKVPLFDFDAYFLGKWTFEWSMPETSARTGGPVHGNDHGLEGRRRRFMRR